MVTCIVAATFGIVFTIMSSIGLGINSSGYYRYSGDNHKPGIAGIFGFQASTYMYRNVEPSCLNREQW